MRAEMNQPMAQPRPPFFQIPGMQVMGRSRRMQHQFGEFIVWLVRGFS